MENTAQDNARRNPAPAGKNRLIGWLVSYESDKLGKAFELRAGRTLISSGQAEARTITLQADSIASPHLALSATPRHTLQVLDIFSESGSFFKRGDSAEEKKVNGPVELKHGDWLRIGKSTRFQVCLIDGPAR